MRILLGLLVCSFVFLQIAEASKATHFRGYYYLNQGDTNPGMAIDVDKLKTVWACWVRKDLPDNLKKYEEEPVILTVFAFRDDVYFFNFEQLSVVEANYLKVEGEGSDFFEMAKRSDTNYEVWIHHGGQAQQKFFARRDDFACPSVTNEVIEANIISQVANFAL